MVKGDRLMVWGKNCWPGRQVPAGDGEDPGRRDRGLLDQFRLGPDHGGLRGDGCAAGSGVGAAAVLFFLLLLARTQTEEGRRGWRKVAGISWQTCSHEIKDPVWGAMGTGFRDESEDGRADDPEAVAGSPDGCPPPREAPDTKLGPGLLTLSPSKGGRAHRPTPSRWMCVHRGWPGPWDRWPDEGGPPPTGISSFAGKRRPRSFFFGM